MEDLTKKQTEVKPVNITPRGWKKPPSLEELKNDLTMADSAHNAQISKIETWLDNLHVRGKALPKGIPETRSKIQPKLIRKQAEWRYASLSEPFLANDDLFDIDPMTWEDAEAARQNSLVLNNQFNTKINKQAFFDSYVRAAVDEGTAIVKVGWESEEEDYYEDIPKLSFITDEEILPLLEEVLKMEEEDPTRYMWDVPYELKEAVKMTKELGKPQRPIIEGYEKVKKTRMKQNRPTLEVCNFRDVIIDPTCQGDIDKASFVIYRFETSLAQLKKENRYHNLDHILVNNNSPSALSDPDGEPDPDASTFTFTDEPRKKIIAYEYWGYWDIDGSGMVKPFVATWVGNVMIRLEDNPFPDEKPPFEFASLMPVRKSMYGEPDGELLEDNQKILGATMRGMIDIMARSANGQMGTRKDALDVTNRRKFQKGLDYEYNGNVDPRLAFHMHTFPEIPNSAQYLLQQQNLEAESMTGVKAFAQGINSDALGDVVAGIKGVMDAAGKREGGILRRLAQGVIRIARKIIAMNAEFLDDEEVIRVTNEDFVKVRRDDLAGNFDLRLDIATAEEDNIKAQELAFMLQTLGASMDIGMQKLILRDIARLRKMPELAKKIETYEPQPDPIEQEKKQLENEEIKARIKEILSQAAENAADAEYKLSQARNKSSDTDLKDLDYVEQESGVKQEREKELRAVQAEGNIKLEKTKQGKETPKETSEVSKPEEEPSMSALDAYLAGRPQ